MKLKKLFAGVVAAAMMLTMAVPAFATEGSAPSDTPVTKSFENTFTDNSDIELTKNYYVQKGIAPAETFNFTIEYVGAALKGSKVTAPNADAVKAHTYQAKYTTKMAAVQNYKETFKIPMSDLDIHGVGQYTYLLQEVKGSTPAVKYDESKLYMIVSVTNLVDGDGNIQDGGLVYTVALRRGNPKTGEKVEGKNAFTNYYGKNGDKDTVHDINLKKLVKGSFADLTEKFEFTVTLKAKQGVDTSKYAGVTVKTKAGDPELPVENSDGTVATIGGHFTVKLGRNDEITIGNLPEGVTYTIVETENEKYRVTGEVTTETSIGDKDVDVEVTNTNPDSPDTGVILDNAPYIALLTIVAVGAVFMVIKKRRNYED